MATSKNVDPVVRLGIDNCFASKHWTKPEDWCELIKSLGIYYIEASADTECDPLYMGAEYTKDWIVCVRRACEKTGVQIANLYSGHGTYSTLGMGHWDPRVRARFRDQWLKEQANTANALGAGLGFFAHAFDDSVLQSKHAYCEAMETLCWNLADIACHGKSIGLKSVGVEQMYAPHQPPWTIPGAKELLRRIYEIGKAPFYITDDVGHMSGQQYFQRPTEEYILSMLEKVKSQPGSHRIWLGSAKAHSYFDEAAAGKRPAANAVEMILQDAENNAHLFAEERDGDIYAWLEETACYSPIIHLQQSDGKSSPHWPFDGAHNKKGVVEGARLLRAIQKSYLAPEDASMPPRTQEITLTLEPFIGTAGNIYDAVRELRESADYWRKYIPKDGLHLSELINLLS